MIQMYISNIWGNGVSISWGGNLTRDNQRQVALHNATWGAAAHAIDQH